MINSSVPYLCEEIFWMTEAENNFSLRPNTRKDKTRRLKVDGGESKLIDYQSYSPLDSTNWLTLRTLDRLRSTDKANVSTVFHS